MKVLIPSPAKAKRKETKQRLVLQKRIDITKFCKKTDIKKLEIQLEKKQRLSELRYCW